MPYVHEAVYAILRAASVGNLRPANYPDFPDKLSSTNGHILLFSAYFGYILVFLLEFPDKMTFWVGTSESTKLLRGHMATFLQQQKWSYTGCKKIHPDLVLWFQNLILALKMILGKCLVLIGSFWYFLTKMVFIENWPFLGQTRKMLIFGSAHFRK